MFKEKHDSLKPYYKYLNKNPFEYQIKILQRKFMWKLLNDEQPKTIRGKSPLQEAQQSTITIITNSQYPSTDLQQQFHDYPIKDQKYGTMRFQNQ